MAGFERLVRKKLLMADKIITPRLDEWLFSNSHLLLSEEHAELLKQTTMTVPRNRAASFSSSSRGMCKRKQVFGYLGVPASGEIDPGLHAIFIDGTWRHLRWQMLLLTAGILTNIEYPFHVPKLRLRGSLDGANLPERWGFELKGTRDTDIVVGMKEPIPYHLLQVHTYFVGVPELERFSLIYEDKKFQTWREEVIEPDPEIMKVVREELIYLNWCIDSRVLPPVLEECKRGEGIVFKKCAYRGICRGCDYDEAEAAGAAASTPVAAPRKRSRVGGPRVPADTSGAKGAAVGSQYVQVGEEAPARKKRQRIHPAD